MDQANAQSTGPAPNPPAIVAPAEKPIEHFMAVIGQAGLALVESLLGKRGEIRGEGPTASQIQAFVDAEANYGLINYLMKHRHGTPFEHGMLTFFVHAPIFVWREWHRHRIGFSYNEESARYKPLAPVFWIPRRDRKMVPVDDWKPGRPKFRTLDEAVPHSVSAETDERELLATERYDREISRKVIAYETAYRAYRESIDDGIAMEVARSVLPVGIYSSCWVTTNPRALLNFLSLRTHEPDATFVSCPQAEIEEAARACEDVLKAGWPLVHRAFVENGRVGP